MTEPSRDHDDRAPFELSDERRRALQDEVRRRLDAKRRSRSTVAPDPPPRYDEVFFEGVAWLDRL